MFVTADDAVNDANGWLHYKGDGIDTLFVDARTLSEFAKKDIQKYRFYDWGVFEYFMVGIILNYAKKRIDLYPQMSSKKIVNDRDVTQETLDYFKRCTAMNMPVFKQYKKDTFLERYPAPWDGAFFHKMFKSVKPTFSYRWNSFRYYAPLTIKRKFWGLVLNIKHKYFG